MATEPDTAEPGGQDRFSSVPDENGWVLGEVRGFPWWIRARVQLVDGVYKLTSLRLDAGAHDAHHAVITADTLRRLPLRVITEAAAVATHNYAIDTDERDWIGEREAAKRVAAARRRDGRTRLGDEHYQAVATIYADAAAATRKPLVAVMEHFGVSRPAASKYVAEARRRGLLAPYATGSSR